MRALSAKQTNCIRCEAAADRHPVAAVRANIVHGSCFSCLFFFLFFYLRGVRMFGRRRTESVLGSCDGMLWNCDEGERRRICFRRKYSEEVPVN